MTVHVVVPDGVDDPRRPSGGNVYDRRLVAGLVALGREVREHRVGAVGLARVLAELPDDAVVLVDGLVASTDDVLVVESHRLRVAVLLHMPGSGPAEPAVLRAVRAVVTTSAWTGRWVREAAGVPADRVHVARPGVDRGPLATGTAAGANLLCVGPLTTAKGYADLLAALADVRDLDWTCRCVGASDLEPAVADALRGVGRVELTGPLSPAELDRLRAVSDLVLAPSHRESYGMALAEGLGRGLPAIATDVGGHPEALGTADDGTLPGILVPVGDPAALGGALRGWLTDAGLRARWRTAAAQRRLRLGTWADTAALVAGVLNRTGPAVVRTGEGRS
ncbi:glycosyltransferase family 4 protein [Nocardioides nitrophenolicus]|uniref:glycosyltransferase family 4 protein n=1 Tax=Nocardioides nitrophenolicus TaxID=60489 RepID=UPI0027DAE7DD|nr:glycosyltransferase family 4 protein [Nocardioides nitrophenolicus]MBM7516180.1 glycosyltransferase involved in cell wall biosynthesis [Nocardioides nitrophenolicus]